MQTTTQEYEVLYTVDGTQYCSDGLTRTPLPNGETIIEEPRWKPRSSPAIPVRYMKHSHWENAVNLMSLRVYEWEGVPHMRGRWLEARFRLALLLRYEDQFHNHGSCSHR